ncbi:MAG: 4-alpha-glucanotransferase, partial [Blautia sp.]|nr:4-alpha-glucanotransferase [Blautia sp.]
EMICTALRSVSKLCVIPIQDYLGLDNSARINQPSTSGINWKWRLVEGQLDHALAVRLHTLAILYGRKSPEAVTSGDVEVIR